MVYQSIPFRNYPAKYFNSDFFQSLISSQKHIMKCRSQFVRFGLTECVSFLTNSDITRGWRNPFCGQRA